jgi:hypothetical protein
VDTGWARRGPAVAASRRQISVITGMTIGRRWVCL